MKVKAYQGEEPYVFVSYSHQDTQVQEIIREMVSNRYRIWYDEGIESGSSWGGAITRRLKGCTQFLVFLSRNSILSENVKDEVGLAKKRKLDIQVVYLDDLDETALDEDLELWLSRIQSAVYRKNCPSDSSFLMEILKILNEDTRESYRGKAREMLEEKYQILDLLSKGSMSKDYKGIRKDLPTPVFIKHFQHSESKMGDVIRRSQRVEIQTYCALSSCPYVPTIYDVFEDDAETYIVEAYVEGKTADMLMEEKCFPSIRDREDWCVDVVKKAAHALRYFHHADPVLVHRDIKPKNLMVSDFGDVYLVDLGTCMEWTPKLKHDAVCLGTVGYAAPEQFGGMGASDPRTDIHALGMTLMHLLTGKNPAAYMSRSVPLKMKVLRCHDKAFHPGLEEIIVKATEGDREKRYQTVEELIDALQSYRQVEPAELIAMTTHSERLVRLAEEEKPAVPPKKRMAAPQGIHLEKHSVPPVAYTGFAVPFPKSYPAIPFAPPSASSAVVDRAPQNTWMETTLLSDEMGTTLLEET